MSFRLLGMTDEERLAFEEASGIKTEGARLIVEESVRQSQELLDQTVREVQGVIGPHGSVTRLQAGGVNISQGLGISVYESGVLKTTIEPDGDLLVGSDIIQPATTSFCVFVNEQTYNNEAMGAGDLLIGDNSTGESNVKFDASEGQLQFRLGRTVNVYMDTDGTLKAGGGAVTIDSIGITLLAGAFPATSYLLWKLADGTLMGNIDGWEYVAGSESGMEIVGQAKNSSFTGTVFVIANDHNGNNESSFKVAENTVVASIGLFTQGGAGTRGFDIQSFVSATNALNNVLYLDTSSSGTVANGLGSAIAFRIEDSASNMDTAGYVGIDWTDKTNGSEDAEFKIGLMKAGTLTNALTLDPTSGLTVNGDVNVSSGSVYRINGTTVLGVSSTWTPSWTNLTVGNGTVTATYQQIGSVVFFHLELVFGSTTSISGDVSFSPPVTQASYGATLAPIGLVRLLAAGAGYVGVCQALTTTSFRIVVNNASATYLQNTALSSTVPGTWTTNDVIQVNGTYFA